MIFVMPYAQFGIELYLGQIPRRQQEISDHFEAESKIPGIMGIIDGSHITLTNIPKRDQDYINRKGFPSL